MPLPFDRQDELVDEFVSPLNSEDTEVFYSPESPVEVFEPKPKKRDKFNMVKNMGVEL
jgi:hypothetical protein